MQASREAALFSGQRSSPSKVLVLMLMPEEVWNLSYWVFAALTRWPPHCVALHCLPLHFWLCFCGSWMLPLPIISLSFDRGGKKCHEMTCCNSDSKHANSRIMRSGPVFTVHFCQKSFVVISAKTSNANLKILWPVQHLILLKAFILYIH